MIAVAPRAGAKVWVAAQWLNPRLQRGPLSHPRCTNIPGGHDGVPEEMTLAG